MNFGHLRSTGRGDSARRYYSSHESLDTVLAGTTRQSCETGLVRWPPATDASFTEPATFEIRSAICKEADETLAGGSRRAGRHNAAISAGGTRLL